MLFSLRLFLFLNDWCEEQIQKWLCSVQTQNLLLFDSADSNNSYLQVRQNKWDILVHRLKIFELNLLLIEYQFQIDELFFYFYYEK